MYEGKQVKEPISRVIRRAEGKGMQQFRLKDNREGNSQQDDFKEKQFFINVSPKKPIQRAVLLLVQKSLESDVKRKKRMIDAADAISSDPPIVEYIIASKEGTVLSGPNMMREGTVSVNSNIDVFGHSFRGKPTGLTSDTLNDLIVNGFNIPLDWSASIRLFSCYAACNEYHISLAKKFSSNFVGLCAVGASNKVMILNPNHHGAIFPEHDDWSHLAKEQDAFEKMKYILLKLDKADPQYEKLDAEIAAQDSRNWAYWEEYYNNRVIPNQGWQIATLHVHKHRHHHRRSSSWINKECSFIGDNPGQIRHVKHVP